MSIDSIFILSQPGDLIAIRTYKNTNRKNMIPTFYQKFVQAYRGSKQEREYPLMKIKDVLFTFLTVSDIMIGAILTEEVPLLEVYQTLFLIVDTFKGVFAEQLSSDKLKAHGTQIELMLDSLLDYGYPLITQRFVLESIVRPSGVIEKIEESLLGRQHIQKEQFSTLEKYIDGCSDVRDYAQYRISENKGDEEVLFDVIEYLDIVIDKNGRAINEEINGEIKMDCNISGTPEIYIYLNQPNQFNDYTAHECVRTEVFDREKVINLIPPTGTTTVFFYNMKGVNMSVPFDFIPRLTQTETSTRVELKLASKPVRGQSFPVEDLNIKLIVPCGVTLGETEVQTGLITQAENVQTIKNSQALLWRVGRLEIDQAPKLTVTYNGKSLGNYIACLRFVVNNLSVSQTKIDKVEVRNGPKSLSKKAKNVSKSGYYEIRLN